MEIQRASSALIGSLTFLALLAGCTPEARQDVGKAGDDLNAAAVQSAQGTKQAVDKADANAKADVGTAVHKTEESASKADQALVQGTKSAVQDSEKAAVKTGHDLSADTAQAVQGTEKAVAKAGMSAKDSADLLTLTPKVKSAILVDDRVKMPDLNIDTKVAEKQVVVNGTASSSEMKDAAMADAKKALLAAKSKYTLVDNIKVGGAAQ